MATYRDASALERDLRNARPNVRKRALRRIAGLTPKARAALFEVADRGCEALVLGTLLALKSGVEPDAGSLERVAVQALALTLGGRNRVMRRAARRALRHGNLPLAAAHPILERWARDPRPAVRRAVSDACDGGYFGHLETSDIALAERMLLDPPLRAVGASTAGRLLGRLLVALTAEIARPDRTKPTAYEVRGKAAVVHAISEAPALGSSVVKALAATDPNVRAPAARILGSINAFMPESIPTLIRAVGDPDNRVSDDACRALGALKQVIVVPGPELFAMLKAPLAHVRANAVRCLPFAQTEPRATWETFVQALDDPAAEVRSAAIETLRHRFRELPDEVLTALRRLTGPPSPMTIRMTAAHSLAHFATDRGDAIALLTKGMNAHDRQVRLAASWALSCLAEHAIAALPALLRAARSDPDGGVRHRALWALRDMGPRATRAIPVLKRLLRDPDEHVRRFAGQALARVSVPE